MWSLGEPFFTNKIPTAAVAFDRKTGDNLSYYFNPEYYDSIDNYTKAWTVAHECLHVILNHGKRIVGYDNLDICNIAMDIVVNHLTVEKFGFERELINNAEELCWVDTVFGPNSGIPTDETFEYYYILLKQNLKTININVKLADSHTWADGTSIDGEGNSVDDMNNDEGLKALGEKLAKAMEGETQGIPEIEGKHFEGGKKAGTIAGNEHLRLKPKRIIKHKWETVIKKWSIKTLHKEVEVEQWVRENRRNANLSKDLMLPSIMDYEKPLENKIDVWFFQDTSGSCSHLAERFFKAAGSLSPKFFNMKLFCFDTKVYETSLKSGKLYGFGGTSFSIIESYIQQTMATKKCRYPHAVFLITDGYGDMVKPQFPKKWYWFLSEAYTHCIPPQSKVFKLSDFE